MTNEELKKKIKENNLYQWQVANAAGITEMTLIRWFRTPMTKERAERVNAAIGQLKAGALND
ncbi:MAG: hypothetical protein IJX57_05605 [Clostridia bacterium]|nr:hypothetical protein [Clostridia bacterium]